MRRIRFVLTVSLIMAAMVVATAVPAFAGGGGTKDLCRFSEGSTIDCRGGSGSGGGGSGGGEGQHGSVDLISGDWFFSGGGGAGGSGSGSGGGNHCTGTVPDVTCVGKGYSGQS